MNDKWKYSEKYAIIGIFSVSERAIKLEFSQIFSPIGVWRKTASLTEKANGK